MLVRLTLSVDVEAKDTREAKQFLREMFNDQTERQNDASEDVREPYFACLNGWEKVHVVSL